MAARSRACQLCLWSCLVILLAALLATPGFAGGRFALVIGNGNYQSAPRLPNAANDARAMSEALERLGFSVDLGIDLERVDFSNLVSDFRAKVKGAAATDVVFFYAGHGFTLDGLNQLVPVDAPLDDKKLLPYQTLRLDEVIATIHASKSQKTIIFLDACSNNPLPKQLQDADTASGLARLQSSTVGKFIVYATQPGEVTRDGKGSNSPFTTALLKHIGEPRMEVNRFLNKVKQDVSVFTEEAQAPFVMSGLLDDFYFNLEQEPDVAEVQPSLAPPPGDVAANDEGCGPFGCEGDAPNVSGKPGSGETVIALEASEVELAAEFKGQPIEGRIVSATPDDPPTPVEDVVAAPDPPLLSGTQPLDAGGVDSPAADETQVAILESADNGQLAPSGSDPVRAIAPLDDSGPAPVSPDQSPVLRSVPDAGTVIHGRDIAPQDGGVASPPVAAEEAQPAPPLTPEPAGNNAIASQPGDGATPAPPELAPDTESPVLLPGSNLGQVIEEPDSGLPVSPPSPQPEPSKGQPALQSSAEGQVVDGSVLPDLDPATGKTGDGRFDVALLTPPGETLETAAEDHRILTRNIQTELKRVGCFGGEADGEWGEPSRQALRAYFKSKDQSTPALEPSDEVFERLKSEPLSTGCVASLAVDKPVKEPPKVIKRDPPKVIKKDPPKFIRKDPPKPIKKDPPKVVKKDPPKVVKKDPPARKQIIIIGN